MLSGITVRLSGRVGVRVREEERGGRERETFPSEPIRFCRARRFLLWCGSLLFQTVGGNREKRERKKKEKVPASS